MTDDMRALVTKYRAFYDVAPYYVLLRETPGTTSPSRTLLVGYLIEIFAVRTDDAEPFMPPSHEYEVGQAELQKIVSSVSQDMGACCSLELFPLRGTVVFGPQGYPAKPAAIYRIRISRWGFVQPAGSSESRALAEVEKHLKALGIARR